MLNKWTKIYSLSLTMTILQACSHLRESDEIKTPKKQLMCLAEAIHGEARGESEEGKIFVGRVIITRVKNGYGKNYCDVVYSKRQFAPKKNPERSSLQAARKSQQLGPNGITHFHSYKNQKTSAAVFSTASQCTPRGKIGSHWGFTCFEYGTRRTASTEE